MTDKSTQPRDGWRYSINYGPDGEENYANVYAADGQFVGNLRTHHAKAIVSALVSASPSPTKNAALSSGVHSETEVQSQPLLRHRQANSDDMRSAAEVQRQPSAGVDAVRQAFETCAQIAGGREDDGSASWPDGHEIAEAIREHAEGWIKANCSALTPAPSPVEDGGDLTRMLATLPDDFVDGGNCCAGKIAKTAPAVDAVREAAARIHSRAITALPDEAWTALNKLRFDDLVHVFDRLAEAALAPAAQAGTVAQEGR